MWKQVGLGQTNYFLDFLAKNDARIEGTSCISPFKVVQSQNGRKGVGRIDSNTNNCTLVNTTIRKNATEGTHDHE